MKTTFLIILCSVLFSNQTEISLNPSQSSLQVFGTSSLHDWESEVRDFTINGILVDDNKIKDLSVKVKTESIKSGKSIMDGKTYDALESEDHPVITFRATELTISGQKVRGLGKLTLAGKTREIAIEANVVDQQPGKLKINGEVGLKMTDYGVDPPSAMFGSLTTGDEVTIRYNILLSN